MACVSRLSLLLLLIIQWDPEVMDSCGPFQNFNTRQPHGVPVISDLRVPVMG